MTFANHSNVIALRRSRLVPLLMPFGIINGMRLQVDKSGRVVLPKPLRQRLGLRAGATLDVTEVAEGLMLRPVTHRPSLIKSKGLLVHTGQPTEPIDWRQLAEDLEYERFPDILAK